MKTSKFEIDQSISGKDNSLEKQQRAQARLDESDTVNFSQKVLSTILELELVDQPQFIEQEKNASEHQVSPKRKYHVSTMKLSGELHIIVQ